MLHKTVPNPFFLQRLPIQSASHWKLRSRKIIATPQICRKYTTTIYTQFFSLSDEVFSDVCLFGKYQRENDLTFGVLYRTMYSMTTSCRRSVLTSKSEPLMWTEKQLSFRFGTLLVRKDLKQLLLRTTRVLTVSLWLTISQTEIRLPKSQSGWAKSINMRKKISQEF